MMISKLACYTRISPNRSSRNGQAVRKFTPHHMAGNLSVETCGSVFASPARGASANYGIGSDGRIGCYVDESERAWTSSSAWNDCQAVTVEVANSSTGGNWPVSDKAFDSLVALAVDVCKRHGMTRLRWSGDRNGSITSHDMFTSTLCMGPYLRSKMPELADRVNAILGGGASAPSAPSAPSVPQGSSGTGFGGTYVCQYNGCRVRTAPGLSSAVVASYNKGQTVVVDDWYVSKDGWIWARYTGASSGQKRYIAIGKATGKPEADDLWIKRGAAPVQPSSKKTMDQVADEIIAGVGGWGNGQDRRNRVEAYGYSYEEVQSIVNRKLGHGGGSKPSKSIDQVAREVIRGDWGNGQDRRDRLRAAGYDAAAVQARVNQLL